MAAPGGDEPDYLLDLWESTEKILEEEQKRRDADPKAAELSDALAKIIKEDQELKRAEEREREERKRLKCLGWWQRPDFAITIARLDIFGLADEPWLDVECFETQDYQISMEPAIQHIINYMTPKLHGVEFIHGGHNS